MQFRTLITQLSCHSSLYREGTMILKLHPVARQLEYGSSSTLSWRHGPFILWNMKEIFEFLYSGIFFLTWSLLSIEQTNKTHAAHIRHVGVCMCGCFITKCHPPSCFLPCRFPAVMLLLTTCWGWCFLLAEMSQAPQKVAAASQVLP